MTGIDLLTVPTVIEWDTAHMAQAAVRMASCSDILEAEAKSAESKISRSIDYFKGSAGDAARVRGQSDRNELVGTADVLAQMATKTASLAEDIAMNIATIKAGIASAEASRWDLFVQDDGTVRSRKSNAETSRDYWPMGAAAVLAKEFETSRLSSSIKGALDAVQRDDQEGAEQLVRFLELLPDSVKAGVAKSLETGNPQLDEILKNYQTDVSSTAAELWPTGLELELIRLKYPDVNPSMLTPEEMSAMKTLLLTQGPEAVGEHFKLSSEAMAAAESTFPASTADGQGDAFRHAYWNALMTQQFGEDWTKEYGTAHEKSAGNVPQREAMDLYNNERGRQIALANPNASPAELQQIIKSEIDKGTLVVLETKDANGAEHSPKLAFSNIPEGNTGLAPGVGIPLPGKK
ncbi:DUF6973 domain-containing protein [Nocardia arizonensis]|uniref:DUF6973 domain-containing protein n=1 Tax=Nocardia arizonensis TaxID=1141647 RepID=UPI0006D0CD9C|nr:hypothetical protein [Nocardia arizonensis]